MFGRALILLGCLSAITESKDLPPWDKSGFHCGTWQKPQESSKGARHYLVFPPNWSVGDAAPTVFVDLQADETTEVKFLRGGSQRIHGPILLQGRNTVKTTSFVYQQYASSLATVVWGVTQEIRMHVFFTWTAPNKDVYSFNYWSISRALVGKEYFVVTDIARDTQYIGQILIVNTEWGNTKVKITLPPRRTDTNKLFVNYLGKMYSNEDKIELDAAYNGIVRIETTSGDLTGARIEADNYIAVWSGNGPMQLSNEKELKINNDATLEQLPPYTAFAKDFISLPPPASTILAQDAKSQMIFKVVGLKRKMTITIGTASEVVQEGHIFIYELTLDPAFYAAGKHLVPVVIRASERVLVSQIFVDEAYDAQRKYSHVLLPPITRFEKSYHYNLKPDYDYRFALIMETAAKSSVLYNNKPETALQWSDAAEDTGLLYSVAYMRKTQGPARITSASGSPVGVFFVGTRKEDRLRHAHGGILGMKLDKRRCFACKGTGCDMRDDDCDGLTNEEACDGVDNDADGLIDEDCCVFTPPDGTGAIAANGPLTAKPGEAEADSDWLWLAILIGTLVAIGLIILIVVIIHG